MFFYPVPKKTIIIYFLQLFYGLTYIIFCNNDLITAISQKVCHRVDAHSVNIYFGLNKAKYVV